MKVQIPYDKEYISYDANPDRVMRSRINDIIPAAPGAELVKHAMLNPIGSKRLADLAVGKKSAVILISDHTRPVPSRDIIPLMLSELRAGSPQIDITLLVATGCHRGTSEEELIYKLGREIVSHEKIVIHDAADSSRNRQIGVLPSGAPLIIDEVAADTELLVAEGFIEPHFFAGFSGGRKSVMPGICDRKTVLGNHCGEFIADSRARTGVLEGNPIHRDMEAAAQIAGLKYIVNVVINEKKKTIAAFAGDYKMAHTAGTEFVKRYCEVPAVIGDIIITSNGGYPLDQNLYQCVKGLTAAEAAARQGAVLIMCAGLADGLGGDSFYRQLKMCETPELLFNKFSATPQADTEPDQWQSQILCRILMNYRVIIVTRPEMKDYICDMKMEYAPDLDTAVKMAGSGEITVIPDGVSLIVSPSVNKIS